MDPHPVARESRTGPQAYSGREHEEGSQEMKQVTVNIGSVLTPDPIQINSGDIVIWVNSTSAVPFSPHGPHNAL